MLSSAEGEQVRTQQQTEQARDTHPLSGAERGTNQDIRINRGSKEHSHPVERGGRNKSGHRMELREEGHSRAVEHGGRDKLGQRKRPRE